MVLSALQTLHGKQVDVQQKLWRDQQYKSELSGQERQCII